MLGNNSEKKPKTSDSSSSIKPELLEKLKDILKDIKKETKLTDALILDFIKKESDIFIPVSVFSNRPLGILEVLVRYLKDIEGLSFKTISTIKKRS